MVLPAGTCVTSPTPTSRRPSRSTACRARGTAPLRDDEAFAIPDLTDEEWAVFALAFHH
jgi:hypothetical protein